MRAKPMTLQMQAWLGRVGQKWQSISWKRTLAIIYPTDTHALQLHQRWKTEKVYAKTRSNSVKLAPSPFTRAGKRALCFFLSEQKRLISVTSVALQKIKEGAITLQR
jgi:hypothetical protein